MWLSKKTTTSARARHAPSIRASLALDAGSVPKRVQVETGFKITGRTFGILDINLMLTCRATLNHTESSASDLAVALSVPAAPHMLSAGKEHAFSVAFFSPCLNPKCVTLHLNTPTSMSRNLNLEWPGSLQKPNNSGRRASIGSWGRYLWQLFQVVGKWSLQFLPSLLGKQKLHRWHLLGSFLECSISAI